MNFIFYSFLAGLFTWVMTIIGSFTVYGLNASHKTILAAMLGFGGGVMVAASFFSLILPAIEFSESLNYCSWLVCLIAFIIGFLLIILIDYVYAKKQKVELNKSTGLLVLAVVIHNIPEGLAIGVAFGGAALSIGGAGIPSAVMLAIGIGVQNLPEGAAISVPLAASGVNKHKAFLFGSLSAIVEPVAALLGAILVMTIQYVLPFVLVLAAAIMIFVVVDELLFEAQSYHKRMTSIGFIVGFVIMMILDLAFK